MTSLDTLVIGGGPAGLAAAVRAAWLGTTRVERQRVGLIEASELLGGLALWRPPQTFAPNSYFTKRDIKALEDACHEYKVEIVRDEVVALEPGEHTRVVCRKAAHEASSVVVTTGLKRSLHTEKMLHDEGRLYWFTDLEVGAGILGRLDTHTEHRRVILCGSRMALATAQIFRALETGLDICCIVEASAPDEVLAQDVAGSVEAVGSDGTDVVVTVRSGPDAAPSELRGDVLLVDFNSYELHCASTGFVAASGVALEKNGYIQVDREMCTNVEGLFAAGDVTGLPSSALKALYEGTMAGFSAYRHVYRLKHGSDPDLNPYFPESIPRMF